MEGVKRKQASFLAPPVPFELAEGNVHRQQDYSPAQRNAGYDEYEVVFGRQVSKNCP